MRIGVVAIWENSKKHFEKVVACMGLDLTVYVRNVISFRYKPKTGSNTDIWNIFGQIFDFGLCFTENRLFWGSAMFMTPLWRHTLHVCTYLGMYGKRKPMAILWCQLDVWGFSFQAHGGNHPLCKPCCRKRLGKTRDNTVTIWKIVRPQSR